MSRDGPDLGRQDLVSVLKTQRLDVVALSREQLAWYLLDPERLQAPHEISSAASPLALPNDIVYILSQSVAR